MDDADAVSVQAWRPRVDGIREVLHARFAEHAYPPHVHDTWTLFVVDEGEVRYGLDRAQHAAVPSIASILPPHVTHDGRPGAPGGYRKRVLYLETTLLDVGLIGAAVDHPVLADAAFRPQIDALHGALLHADDALEAETRLHAVVDRIRRSLGGPVSGDEDAVPVPDVAERLRAILDAELFASPSITAAARVIGVGPTAAARTFRDAFGIPPHAYVLGRRLDAARDRILDGVPLAQVAAEVGFADQAHLSRRFKSFLGTTPGQFARLRARR